MAKLKVPYSKLKAFWAMLIKKPKLSYIEIPFIPEGQVVPNRS